MRPEKDLVLLNAALIAYLAAIISWFPFGHSFELLTFAEDARQYLAVRNEFFDLEATGFSATRPFLYPLFLKIVYDSGGVLGVWLAQLGLWMVAANLVYAGIKRLFGNRVPAIAAVICFASNLTLIALTYHALTEVVAVFLICWLLYLVTSQNRRSPAWFLKVATVCVALALVKPLFFYPLLIVLLSGITFHFRKLAGVKFTGALLLIIAPLLLQIGVMRIKYGKWEFSQVSSMTLRAYLVAEGFQQIEGMNRKAAIDTAMRLSTEEAGRRLYDHRDLYFENYRRHIAQNIAGDPFYLQPNREPGKAAEIQWALNVRYARWIMVALLLSGIVFAHQLFTRQLRKNLILYVPLLLLVYILLSIGISFLQGDRLTVIALPAGIFSIAVPVAYALKEWRKKASPTNV